MYHKKPKKQTEPTVLKASIVNKKVNSPNTNPVKKKYKTLQLKKQSNLWKRSKEVLELLKKNPVINQNYPLVVGVSKLLQDQYPEIPNRLINTAMFIHTHSELYLRNLSIGIGRFNLDGSFCSPIDETGMINAKTLLEKIYRRPNNGRPRRTNQNRSKQNLLHKQQRSNSLV